MRFIFNCNLIDILVILNKRHIYKEENCVVDKLASLSIIFGTKKWWFGSLDDIMRLSYRDMIPLSFYAYFIIKKIFPLGGFNEVSLHFG